MIAHKKTLIFASILLLLTLQKYAGFMIFVFLPFFMIYVTRSLFLMLKRPELRKYKAIHLMIWIVTLLMICSVHWYWSLESRRDAQTVILAIEAFQLKNGIYPHTLAELGLNEQALRHQWMLVYSDQDQHPFVVYADSFMVFAHYRYHFKTHQWTHHVG